jgi:hypothetical protein
MWAPDGNVAIVLAAPRGVAGKRNFTLGEWTVVLPPTSQLLGRWPGVDPNCGYIRQTYEVRNEVLLPELAIAGG